MANIVIGIDPSLTGLAVCTWREDQDVPEIVRFTSEPCGPNVVMRIARYQNLLSELFDKFGCAIHRSLVLIEGYSFASPNKATILGEFGGLLRQELIEVQATALIEVSPASLKKFCTGKGNGNKEIVAAHVAKRWGYIGPTNDHTDAYVLARIGRAYLGWDECDNQAQRDVIEQLRNPEKPKRRRAKA